MIFKPTAEDLVQMEGQGISAAQVQAQIDNFKSGFPKSRLDAKRICTGLAVLLPLLHLCGVDAPMMKLIFNIYLGVYGAVLIAGNVVFFRRRFQAGR